MVTSETAHRRPTKAILLGDFGAGKSALLYRLANGNFTAGVEASASASASAPTANQRLRFPVGIAAIRLPDGTKVLLHDTCGMERLDRSLTRGYYRGAACVILVADAANLHSVRGLDYWNTEAECYATDVPKVLVFNKCDSPMADAGLIGGEIELYRARLGCCCSAVVSAKTGCGIDQLLLQIAEARQLHWLREREILCGLLMGQKSISLRQESEEENESPAGIAGTMDVSCCSIG